MRLHKAIALITMIAALLCTSFTQPAGAVSSSPFPDVPTTAWYWESVTRAKNLGLISGYADGEFHPTDSVTRAQFVQILYNKYGGNSNAAETRSGFTDVPSNAWYAQAVTWATKGGIVNGVGNKKFAPDASLTREQLASMLYAKAGRPKVNANRQLSKYLDYKDVSEWARDGMAWCVQTGIVKGTSNTSLNPKGVTTRAEAATFVVRYVDRE